MGILDRLKANRNNGAEALQKAIEKHGGGFKKDNRFWKYTFNDKGVSQNVIRLLPISIADYEKVDAGEIPSDIVLTPAPLCKEVQFKHEGRQYREWSLESLGKNDPVREHDAPLWDVWKKQGKQPGKMKDTLVARLAKDVYVCNIYVVKDGTNPENNGKNFLFVMKQSIKNMIDERVTPKLDCIKPIKDPFDFLEGAFLNLNFVGEKMTFGSWSGLVAKDWKNCSFGDPCPLAETEEEMEEILGNAYSLWEFYPEQRCTKSYEELEKRFKQVMGIPDDQDLHDAGASKADENAFDKQLEQAQSTAPSVEATAKAEAAAAKKAAATTAALEEAKATPADESSNTAETMDDDDFEALLNGAL